MATYTLTPAATRISWQIIKGADDFTIVIPVLDATNIPVTVDGWTVKAQVRRLENGPLLHEWSTTVGNAVCVDTTVQLTVSSAVTGAWTWAEGQISVVVTDLGGRAHCIAAGRIQALPEITQLP